MLSDEGVLPGCFYLATLEDASWLKCYMTRTRTGALPGHVPSAAMDDGSVEDASELRLGGYAVLEGEAYGAIRPRRLSLRGDDQDGGASPNEQSEPGDEESDYAHHNP